MAGLRGNNAYWMFNRQTAKGSVATVSSSTTVKTPYSAGGLEPAREISSLSETDNNRDQGVSYVKKTEAKGNPEMYVRDMSTAALLFFVLGGDNVTTKTATKFEGTALISSEELTSVSFGVEPWPANAQVGAQVKNANIPAGATITEVKESEKKLKISAKTTAAIALAANNLEILNYEHELYPQNSLPYVTFWSMIAETLYERHQDCMLSDIDIKATAGSPLTAQATILGCATTRLTSDPGSTIPLQRGTVYNFNNGAVTIGSEATDAIPVSSMNLTVANNVVAQQTDKVTPLDVAVGKRAVGCTFDMIFENLKEYNKFMYGSETGTAVSAELYKTSLKYRYELGTNNFIEFKIPFFAYEEFPIAPEVQGAPLVVAVKGVAQRSPENIITAKIGNQQQTY